MVGLYSFPFHSLNFGEKLGAPISVYVRGHLAEYAEKRSGQTSEPRDVGAKG